MAAAAKTKQTLPNGCTRDRARQLLDLYDVRKNGGFKNQQTAARDQLAHATGMTVTALRKWLVENPAQDEPTEQAEEAPDTHERVGGDWTDATVTLIGKPDGKSPWHHASQLYADQTRCGLGYTSGNWHVVEGIDRRAVRHANRPVCANCIGLEERARKQNEPTAPAPARNGYHQASPEDAAALLRELPTGVLVVWIPSDPGTDDIPIAWRLRKDDYGIWLERKNAPGKGDKWGIARQMKKSEADGLIEQLRSRNGGAAAFADNEQGEEQGMATTSTRKAAARKTSGAKTTSRRGSMTTTAAKDNTAGVDAKQILDALNTSVKAKGIKGLKVESSKAGGKRYYRFEGKTLAIAYVGKRGIRLAVGKAAPAKLEKAGVESAATKIAKEAEAAAK